MVTVMYKDIRENEKHFQELRLKYVVDYATEASFSATLEGGNLGISYQDLQNVRVMPENALGVLKSVILLSYDMALSETNFNSMDSYISSAVIAVSDGYYLATPRDFNSTKLSWGIKKPYTIKYKNGKTVVAYNISNENWYAAIQNGNNVILDKAINWNTPGSGGVLLSNYIDSNPDRGKILTSINKQIMEDINYNIRERNKTIEKYKNGTIKEVYTNRDVNDFIYLPSVQTTSGVNTITKPSMFVTLTGVDFAGTQRLETQSVGGYTIDEKKRVLGFIENGKKYYCYEGQLADLTKVQTFYNSVEEAASAGYYPHLAYLSKSTDR